MGKKDIFSLTRSKNQCIVIFYQVPMIENTAGGSFLPMKTKTKKLVTSATKILCIYRPFFVSEDNNK